MKNQKGMMLIEVMIIVAIIGILAAVAIPQFNEMMGRSYYMKYGHWREGELPSHMHEFTYQGVVYARGEGVRDGEHLPVNQNNPLEVPKSPAIEPPKAVRATVFYEEINQGKNLKYLYDRDTHLCFAVFKNTDSSSLQTTYVCIPCANIGLQ